MEEKIILLLQQILEEVKNLKVKTNNEEWLNASAFCRKFGISRPTLKKRVNSGLIEKFNFGDKSARYRWKSNEKVK